jgi:hypothetical protein
MSAANVPPTGVARLDWINWVPVEVIDPSVDSVAVPPPLSSVIVFPAAPIVYTLEPVIPLKLITPTAAEPVMVTVDEAAMLFPKEAVAPFPFGGPPPGVQLLALSHSPPPARFQVYCCAGANCEVKVRTIITRAGGKR